MNATNDDRRQIRVLGGTFLGLATGYSVFVGVVFGLLVPPLTSEFGWQRTEIAVGFTICTYTIVALAPVVGAWIDRLGVRKLLLPSLAAYALALAGLSMLNARLWGFYLLCGAVAAAGAVTLPTTYSRLIVSWFTARRGLALSIALSGVGVSAIALPPALQWVITHAGWRTVPLVLAAATLGLTLPVAWAWLHEPACAQAARCADRSSALFAGLRSLLNAAALRRMLWAAALLGAAVGGTLAHLIAQLTDALGSAQKAAYAFSVLGASTLASRLACGWLLDRVSASKLAGIVFALTAAGLAWLASAPSEPAVYVALVLLGLGFGADFDVISYLVSRHVPLGRFTQAYGLLYSSFLLGAGAGPVLAGLAFDRGGDYALAFSVLAILCLSAAVVFATLPRYSVSLDETRAVPVV